MNIAGRPEELATFIRALNDEPIYMIEEPPRIQPIRKVAQQQQNVSTAWLAIGVTLAAALAMLAHHV